MNSASNSGSRANSCGAITSARICNCSAAATNFCSAALLEGRSLAAGSHRMASAGVFLRPGEGAGACQPGGSRLAHEAPLRRRHGIAAEAIEAAQAPAVGAMLEHRAQQWCRQQREQPRR